jgi:hypothetical protein
MSRSANVGRYRRCIAGKSPDPKLPCGAANATGSKWSDADGRSQAQRRNDVAAGSNRDEESPDFLRACATHSCISHAIPISA